MFKLFLKYKNAFRSTEDRRIWSGKARETLAEMNVKDWVRATKELSRDEWNTIADLMDSDNPPIKIKEEVVEWFMNYDDYCNIPGKFPFLLTRNKLVKRYLSILEEKNALTFEEMARSMKFSWSNFTAWANANTKRKRLVYKFFKKRPAEFLKNIDKTAWPLLNITFSIESKLLERVKKTLQY